MTKKNENLTNTQVKGKLKNGNPINESAQFGNPNGNKQGRGLELSSRSLMILKTP